MATLTKHLMELLEVKQLHTSPYHPQPDGMLASTAYTQADAIQKKGDIGKDWDPLCL